MISTSCCDPKKVDYFEEIRYKIDAKKPRDLIGAADDLYVAAHELDGEARDFDLTDRDIEDFVETQAENFLRVGTKAAGIAYSLNFLIRHHGYPAVMKAFKQYQEKHQEDLKYYPIENEGESMDAEEDGDEENAEDPAPNAQPDPV